MRRATELVAKGISTELQTVEADKVETRTGGEIRTAKS
jgi:hypothetical protein